VVKSLAPIIGTTIGAALNVVGDIAAVVINVISNVLGVISGIVNKAIDAINVIIRAVNRIPGVNIPQIGGVGSSGGGTAGATGTGFSQLSSLGQGVAGAVAGAVAAGGFGGGGGATGGGAAGGGGGAGATGILGATNVPDLIKRLQNVSDAFTDLTFLVTTNGISQKAAAQQFDKLTKEFALLENQANRLTVDPVLLGGTPFGQAQNVTNVYVSGAVDPEGTARAVANQLNSQAARSVTALRDRVN